MRTVAIVLGLSLLVPWVNGCAFGTRHATLIYPPASGITVATNAPPQAQLGKVSVGTFSDERAEKVVIGYVRNGYGMKTAEVHLDSDVVPFINAAVQHELKQAGWEIVDQQTATNSNIPVISGEVLVLHCDAYMSYEGDATVMIHATRNGHEVFKKTYSGNGGGHMNWGMTGKSYGIAISEAVQEALLNFVRDMPTIMRQE
jgi:hypothetical protein